MGIFLELQKKVLFLSGQALAPPPLLVAGPLKTELHFFAASLMDNGHLPVI